MVWTAAEEQHAREGRKDFARNVKESIEGEQGNARIASDEAVERLARAWDEGFTACAHEHMKQEKDPAHPITRTNPYQTADYQQEWAV
ncbi:regulator of replication initiation timing [Paenarthrobacter nicotinovorans]|uniref:Regulator of replication initiation timing n=1 Tax=Paenarthrobacter nicotinovorans TaxID=29320 RepID=A0ABT9TLM8_PAENI|nr:hypothetical protein [Paenarthrobacter nicotinovorans]MDQ0102300.1 regulator of replication initiation timing [Paenarthrobacter nicotinovorans]